MIIVIFAMIVFTADFGLVVWDFVEGLKQDKLNNKGAFEDGRD